MSEVSAPEAPARRQFFRKLVSAASQSPAAAPWQPVEGVTAGSGDVLWAGWCGDGGLFVVGDEGTIFSFADGKWTRLASPVPLPLHALWGRSSNDLYAVGWMGTILHFDGEAWRLQRGCEIDADGKYAASAANTPLFDLVGDGEGRLWAVGDRGWILHYDGKTWQPEDSGTTAHLRAITTLSDGRLLAAGGDGTVLLRDAEGHWQGLDCPLRSQFQAAMVLEDGGVLLAGGRYFMEANGFRGDLLLWRDGAFTRLGDDQAFARFRALAPYRDAALAVGDKGQIHHIIGDRVVQLESGTTHDLLGILPLPTGEALAVGDFGTILTAAADFHEAIASPATRAGAASQWEEMDSGSDRQLWGAWADPGSGRLYAFGEEGLVMTLEEGRWERLPKLGDLGLRCLCADGAGGLYAAGQLGEIHNFDGRTWRKHFDLHVDVTILALWSDASGEAFAIGDEGLALHWDGKSWERMISGTKSALYGLWAQDNAHMLAVGDFGMILRWNGTRWDEFHAGTENFLFDVWGSGLDNIFTVGLSGTIGHFDGRRWTLTPARARADLLALTGLDGAVFAVGSAGSILRHAEGQWQLEASGFDGGLRGVAASPEQGVIAVGDGGTILRRVADEL
ncbi:MAG: hypothetical protein RIC87_18425 [Kiloniellales bacterium]